MATLPATPPHIGTLAEKSLHAALKAWVARPGDQLEVRLGNFVIDIVRDGALIEIQTGNFGAIRRKLERLLPEHKVRLLRPIAQEKWIVRQTAAGEFVSRRKSPRHGRVEELFKDLVYAPHLLAQPNLTIEVLLTQEEEILRDDGLGSWRRRRWSLYDHRLLAVLAQVPLAGLDAYQALLPSLLPQPFTNQVLAAALGCRPALAQRITYTLRAAGALAVVGKQGNALLYRNLLGQQPEVGPK